MKHMKNTIRKLRWMALILGLAAGWSGEARSAPAVLRVIEADDENRNVDGWLKRDGVNERILIVRGKALLPDGWRSGELLVVFPANTERYEREHYDMCPLPGTDKIHVRTRAGNARVIRNARILEGDEPKIAAYGYYMVAGRFKSSGNQELVTDARVKTVTYFAKELGMERSPIDAVTDGEVKTTKEFQNKVKAYQAGLGVEVTGKVDYKTLKKANDGIPASRFSLESAASPRFKR